MSSREYKQALQENIWKLYGLHIANGMILFIAIFIPFLQENGLSLRDIFLLQSIFSIAMLVLEIPSGYLSDTWGRKNTLIAGSVCGVFAYITYALSTQFIGFMTAELFLAVAFSFASGTVEALTYDTLLEEGETDAYKKIHGKQLFCRFGSEAFGGLLAGALVLISLRTAFWVQIIPASIGFLLALSLEEPKRHKQQETRHLDVMWNVLRQSLIHNIPLRSIIALSAIISTLTLSLFWFTQPYQIEVGLPLTLFGIAHAIVVLAGAFASTNAHRISRVLGDRLLLIYIAVTVIVGYIALGFILSLWGLLFFLVVRVAWGLLTPLISDIINRMTTSDIRATVLSIRAFVSRALFACLVPLFGYMADVLTLNTALLTIGVVGGISIGSVIFLMRKVWNTIPE